MNRSKATHTWLDTIWASGGQVELGEKPIQVTLHPPEHSKMAVSQRSELPLELKAIRVQVLHTPGILIRPEAKPESLKTPNQDLPHHCHCLVAKLFALIRRPDGIDVPVEI